MIIDGHSHAWQYPEHFTDQFRHQIDALIHRDSLGILGL